MKPRVNRYRPKQVRRMPTCLKCGKEHFNFVTCGSPQVELRPNREKPKFPSIRIFAKRQDGLSDWGRDKTRTLTRVAGNVFVTGRREPMQVGRVLYGDEQIRLPKMPSRRGKLIYPEDVE
jgi:hypothetical protein